MARGSLTPPASSSSSSSSVSNESAFETFLEGWYVRQEHYLDELITTKQHYHESTEADLNGLINQILMHYQEYYEEKSRFTQRNVFPLFSPPWFTSLERTFLWVAGFRPALAFSVLTEAVTDLSSDQEERVRKLRAKIRVEERTLADEVAKVHESIASPPLMEIIKSRGNIGERKTELELQLEEEQRGIGTLKSELESIVGSADTLRTSTVAKIVEILNPIQNLNFLTAVSEMQLQIHSLGLQLEAEGFDLDDN